MCGPLASLGALGLYPQDPVCLSTRAQVAVRTPEPERATRGRCPSRACAGWPPERQLWRVWCLKNFWSRGSGEGTGGAGSLHFLTSSASSSGAQPGFSRRTGEGKAWGSSWEATAPCLPAPRRLLPQSARLTPAGSEGVLLSMGSLCRGCQGCPATKSRGPTKAPTQTLRESFCVDGHCDPEKRFRMEFSCIFSIYNTFPFTDYRRKSLMLRDPTPEILKLRESP